MLHGIAERVLLLLFLDEKNFTPKLNSNIKYECKITVKEFADHKQNIFS